MDPMESFDKNSAIILRLALNVELLLEDFIAQYFFDIKTNKLQIFKDLIISQFDFEDKKNIFKDICKFEKIDKEIISKISSEITFVQQTRNRISHDLAVYSEQYQNYILRKRPSLIRTNEEILQVNEQLSSNISDKYTWLLREFIGIDNLLLKSKRYRPKFLVDYSVQSDFKKDPKTKYYIDDYLFTQEIIQLIEQLMHRAKSKIDKETQDQLNLFLKRLMEEESILSDKMFGPTL
jgi:hypothetical protein